MNPAEAPGQLPSRPSVYSLKDLLSPCNHCARQVHWVPEPHPRDAPQESSRDRQESVVFVLQDRRVTAFIRYFVMKYFIVFPPLSLVFLTF